MSVRDRLLGPSKTIDSGHHLEKHFCLARGFLTNDKCTFTFHFSNLDILS